MRRKKRRIIPQYGVIDVVMLRSFAQGIVRIFPESKLHHITHKESWDKLLYALDLSDSPDNLTFSEAESDPAKFLIRLPKQESLYHSILAIRCMDFLLQQDAVVDEQLLKALTQCVALQRPIRRVSHSLRSVNSVQTVIHAQTVLLSKSQDATTIARNILHSFVRDLTMLPLYEQVLVFTEAMRVLSVVLSMDIDEVKALMQESPINGYMKELLLHEVDIASQGSALLTEEEFHLWRDTYLVYQAWQKPVTHCRSIIKILNKISSTAAAFYLTRLLYDEYREDFLQCFKPHLSRIKSDIVRDDIILSFCGNCDFYLPTAYDRFMSYFVLLTSLDIKIKALISAVQRMQNFMDLERTLRYILALEDVQERTVLAAALLQGCDDKIEALQTNQQFRSELNRKPSDLLN